MCLTRTNISTSQKENNVKNIKKVLQGITVETCPKCKKETILKGKESQVMKIKHGAYRSSTIFGDKLLFIQREYICKLHFKL